MIALMDLIEKWAAALDADSGLAAWVAETAPGRTLNIFVGVSSDDPPGERAAPFVALHPLARSGGDEVDARDYLARVTLGLVGGRETAGAVTTVTGLAALEREFAPRVLAVCSAATEAVSLAQVEYEFLPEFHPLLLLAMDVTVSVPTLIGAEINL